MDDWPFKVITGTVVSGLIVIVLAIEDVLFDASLTVLVTLSVGLTKKELTQMKALSGLKGNVTNPQIVRKYLKQDFYFERSLYLQMRDLYENISHLRLFPKYHLFLPHKSETRTILTYSSNKSSERNFISIVPLSLETSL